MQSPFSYFPKDVEKGGHFKQTLSRFETNTRELLCRKGKLKPGLPVTVSSIHGPHPSLGVSLGHLFSKHPHSVYLRHLSPLPPFQLPHLHHLQVKETNLIIKKKKKSYSPNEDPPSIPFLKGMLITARHSQTASTIPSQTEPQALGLLSCQPSLRTMERNDSGSVPPGTK